MDEPARYNKNACEPFVARGGNSFLAMHWFHLSELFHMPGSMRPSEAVQSVPLIILLYHYEAPCRSIRWV